jgi:hypothetical protein
MSSKPNAVASPRPGAAIADTPVDREARNPYYRWIMHLGLPLVISIVAHVGLFGATALVTFTVMSRPAIEVGEYDAGVFELDVSGGLTFDDNFTPPPPEEMPSLDDLTMTQITPVTDFNIDDTPVGAGPTDLGPGPGRDGGILGLGGGAGEAGEGGFGGGFGARMALDAASVWDLSVQANHIAYVVDFSGSLVTVIDDLKRELKRSVGRLKPSQTFNVILFFGGGRTESFQPALVAATPENRQAFARWIDGFPAQGGTHPLAAVQRALSMNPEAIFFFSDGIFENELVDQITRANTRARAQFLCLLFDERVFEDGSGLPPGVDEQAQRLRRLAEANMGRGGKAGFKIVTLRDLYGG